MSSERKRQAVEVAYTARRRERREEVQGRSRSYLDTAKEREEKRKSTASRRRNTTSERRIVSTQGRNREGPSRKNEETFLIEHKRSLTLQSSPREKEKRDKERAAEY